MSEAKTFIDIRFIEKLADKLTIVAERAKDDHTVRSIEELSNALLDRIETGNEHLINQYIDSL